MLLHQHHLLNDKNFNAIKQNSNLIVFFHNLKQLSEKPQLLKKYFSLFVKHNATYIRFYLEYLTYKNIFNETYLDILAHLTANDLVDFIYILNYSHLFVNNFNQLTRLSLFKSNHLKKLNKAFFYCNMRIS